MEKKSQAIIIKLSVCHFCFKFFHLLFSHHAQMPVESASTQINFSILILFGLSGPSSLQCTCSSPDPGFRVVSSRVWVRIPVVTLVPVSEALSHNSFRKKWEGIVLVPRRSSCVVTNHVHVVVKTQPLSKLLSPPHEQLATRGRYDSRNRYPHEPLL